MLRWKIRFTPMLVVLALIVVALANAKSGNGIGVNLGW